MDEEEKRKEEEEIMEDQFWQNLEHPSHASQINDTKISVGEFNAKSASQHAQPSHKHQR
jgi:hypothetical protein